MYSALIKQVKIIELQFQTTADFDLNGFSIQPSNKQKSLVIENAGGQLDGHELYSAVRCFQEKKKKLSVLRILISYSAHAGYDLCID